MAASTATPGGADLLLVPSCPGWVGCSHPIRAGYVGRGEARPDYQRAFRAQAAINTANG
jgi:hypothetical protein